MMYPKTYLLLICSFLLAGSLSAQSFKWNKDRSATTAKSPTANTGDVYDPKRSLSSKEVEVGEAIFYADYYDGNETAYGEIYRSSELTAAHRTHPLGTLLKITRLDNNMSVTVRVNDRGPFSGNDIVDLSKRAAQEIDLVRAGRKQVSIQVVGYSKTNPTLAATSNNQLTARGLGNSGYNNNTANNRQATTNNNRQTASYDYAPQQQQQSQQTYTPPPAAPAYRAPNNTPVAAPVQNKDEVNVITNQISGFAIQLGSYRNFANASRHVQDLQHKGSSNVYVKQDQRADGSPINKVIIGPYSNKTDAQNAMRDMRLDGLVVTL